MNPILYIEGQIGGTGKGCFTLQDCRAFLDANKDAKEIDVYINSGGGYTVDGYAIYDMLMNFSGVVNTYVNGRCGSIATVIFQAGKKGSRVMFPNSEFFVHNPFLPAEGAVPMEAKDAKLLAEDLEREETKMAQFYSRSTGKSVETLKPIMDRATTLSPAEAKQLGFIDEIVNKKLADFVRYEIVAFYSPKNTEMENEELKKEVGGLKTVLANIDKKIAGLFKKQFKNEAVVTVDGATIYVDGSVDVGSKVYTDEAFTVAHPDATVKIDNKEIIIKDGAIESVVEVETVEALQAKLAEANATIETLKSEVQSKVATEQETETIVAEIKKEFVAMSEKVKSLESLATGTKPATGGVQHEQRNEPKAGFFAQKLEEMKSITK